MSMSEPANVKPPESGAGPAGKGGRDGADDNIYTQFIKEVAILILGVMIGFVWSQYFREVSQEAHLVVSLSIVVLCMVRFIYLMSSSRG